MSIQTTPLSTHTVLVTLDEPGQQSSLFTRFSPAFAFPSPFDLA
jgi:hypothetical protein